MDEQKIIDQLNQLKKHKDIILENGINKTILKEIMNRRYSGEELEAFKWERSRQREMLRKEKYYQLYHSDENYKKEKQKKARIRYYINLGIKKYNK